MNIDEYIKTPDALFHYTKTSIAIENILHMKKLKLSLLNDSNDPKEYKYKSFNITKCSSDPNITLQLKNKVSPIINRILRKEYRVMCFCTNNKPTLILSDGRSAKDEYAYSKGWGKSRMWSQYGQNHFGICLVFSKSKLEDVLNNIKPPIKNFRRNMCYSQIIRATTLDECKIQREGIEKYPYNHIMENYEELFFRKHVDYRDEAEFRVVIFDPDKKLRQLDISSLIKCVIGGERISEAYIPLIQRMCAGLNIECRQVYSFNGELRLKAMEG